MLLEVRELKKYYSRQLGFFKTAQEPIKALDGVSFTLNKEEILGIVGESGCGKTTLAKLILKLIPPTSGEVSFGPEINNLRRDVGVVFQDPLLSLSPRMRIWDILAEPFLIHRLGCDFNTIIGLLTLVGLQENILRRYPANLSGGQRQRVCIARGLGLRPKLLILDEPLSSLDAIIQKQILELLLDLKNRLNITYIFISHNIRLIKKISTDIIVMAQGKIAEQGKSSEVFSSPKSEYTKKLLEASS